MSALAKKLLPLGIILFAGCSELGIRIGGLDAPLPQESSIVFLNEKNRGEFQLGFINQDGNELSYLPKDPQRYFPYPFNPIWTDDSKNIIFRDPQRLKLMVISKEGYEQDFDLHFGEYPSLIQGEVNTVVLQSYDDNDNDYLYQANLESGKSLMVYLSATSIPTSGVSLAVGTRSLDHNRLVYQREWNIDRSADKIENEIAIYNLLTEETTVLIHQEGDAGTVALKAPAFSPDGQWIAYTAFDGIYIIPAKGGLPQRIIKIEIANRNTIHNSPPHWYYWDEYPPIPSWSPDSQWIVYHRCMLPFPKGCERGADFNIYKVNIETGEEILLVEGGLNPYWRLTPVEETQAP